MKRVSIHAVWLLALGLMAVATGIGSACDDTVLSLVAAGDPRSLFASSLVRLNELVAGLGEALNNRLEGLYQERLEALMQGWMRISTAFAAPPAEADVTAEVWREKLRGISRKIGSVRSLITERDSVAAHDLVLQLSEDLNGLLETPGSALLQPVFREGVAILSGLEGKRRKGEAQAFADGIASLTRFLDVFSAHQTGDFSRELGRLKEVLAVLGRHHPLPADDDDPEFRRLGGKALEAWHGLRARMFLLHWRPVGSPADISSKAGEIQ